MRILLTGFGPFGEVVDNPSERVVEYFARESIPGHELVTEVLPVSYKTVRRRIPELILSSQADLAMLLGVAGKADEIRVERWAINRAAGADIEGVGTRARPILRGGPEGYISRLALNRLKRALSAVDVPAAISSSAGEYLCNYAYYWALHTIETAGIRTRCLFIHQPPDEKTYGPSSYAVAIDFMTQMDAVRVLINSLARPPL